MKDLFVDLYHTYGQEKKAATAIPAFSASIRARDRGALLEQENHSTL